jgi:succinate dehydrogenase / fumarate reductase, cytochrome b subunit
MKLLQSTIGLKSLMAVTGVILIGFVIIHMLGNLQIYLPLKDGVPPIDAYGELLKSNAAVLWGARLTLLFSVGAHIYSAVVLTLRAKAARPQNYESRKWMGSTYAVRTMRWGGALVLLFIVYHLLHFTVGLENAPLFTEHAAGSVRANVINGFQNKPIAIFYIIAQCALGLHLTHGVWSLFRTLGVSSPVWSERVKSLAIFVGVLITVGNISIPLSIMLGLIN